MVPMMCMLKLSVWLQMRSGGRGCRLKIEPGYEKLSNMVVESHGWKWGNQGFQPASCVHYYSETQFPCQWVNLLTKSIIDSFICGSGSHCRKHDLLAKDECRRNEPENPPEREVCLYLSTSWCTSVHIFGIFQCHSRWKEFIEVFLNEQRYSFP